MLEHEQSRKDDCFRTCVECILDLPAASIPNLCHDYEQDWFYEAGLWLRLNTRDRKPRIRGLVRVAITGDEHLYRRDSDPKVMPVRHDQDCFIIQDVMTPRGLKHSTVSHFTRRGNEYSISKVHDPHPSCSETWQEHEHILSFYALIATDLWRL